MSSRFSCPANIQGTPTSTVTVHVIVYDNAGTPAPVAGASATLAGPTGFSISGTTDGSGTVTFLNVPAPSLFVTLSIDTGGTFDFYNNTFTIETLPVDVTYVVGPPGTATGAQIQLPPLVSGGTGVCNTNLAISQPAGIPARPNLRWMRGNFCGRSVAGMPAVPGGSPARPDMVLNWFIDRYGPGDQATIFADFAGAGFTHWQLSWPDSRVNGGVGGGGQTIAQFVATAQAVQAAGFYTVVFLTSKDFDPYGMDGTSVAPVVDGVIAGLDAVGAADIYCVGWELNLFNDPGTLGGPLAPFQDQINHIAGLVVPATPLYVHFSAGVASWQPNGGTTSTFWTPNVGQLTGLLWQQSRSESPDCPNLQNRLADVQVRFGGAFGFPADSGFGHPFDVVAFEQGASEMFNGTLTEAQGEALGLQAIHSPVPNPGVPCMGYFNGCTGNP